MMEMRNRRANHEIVRKIGQDAPQFVEAENVADIQQEANEDPPARNEGLAGCLPSIVKARHGVCVTSAGWIVHWD